MFLLKYDNAKKNWTKLVLFFACPKSNIILLNKLKWCVLCDLNKLFDQIWVISLFTCSILFKKKQNKGNAKRGISPRLKIWSGDLYLWPWKSIGFQILLRTKYVPSLVKIHWRMLILECSQGCYGRTDGSVTISLRNLVGEGINNIWTFF